MVILLPRRFAGVNKSRMCVGEARRVFVVRIALMGVVKRCSGECQEQARHDADVKEFLQPPSIPAAGRKWQMQTGSSFSSSYDSDYGSTAAVALRSIFGAAGGRSAGYLLKPNVREDLRRA